jgi:hypothetical protein
MLLNVAKAEMMKTVTEFSFFWNAYFMQILANIAQFYSRNIFAIFWLARESENGKRADRINTHLSCANQTSSKLSFAENRQLKLMFKRR